MRSNNGPSLVEVAQLQRDGGADDRLLPIVGDRQPAHPFHPIVAGAVDEVAAGRLQVARKRLVRTEYQMQGPRQHERRFAVDQRQRRVGGQAYDGAFTGIADVVAAERALHERLAVVAGRTHPDGDARQAGHRLDDAKDLRRTKNATELAETRDKVGDFDFAALAIDQQRGDDRGVAHIFGLILRQVVEHDVGESFFLLAGQQSGEDRVAVEARIAPPDDPRTRIDQGSRPPVADDGKIQPMVFHPTASPRLATIWSNQARTSSGPLK